MVLPVRRRGVESLANGAVLYTTARGVHRKRDFSRERRGLGEYADDSCSNGGSMRRTRRIAVIVEHETCRRSCE